MLFSALNREASLFSERQWVQRLMAVSGAEIRERCVLIPKQDISSPSSKAWNHQGREGRLNARVWWQKGRLGNVTLGIETQLLPSWAQAPADALTVHTEPWRCREPRMEERLMAPSPSLGNYWLLRTHWKVHKTQEDSSTPAVLQWLNSVGCKTKRHGYRKVSCKEEEGT